MDKRGLEKRQEVQGFMSRALNFRNLKFESRNSSIVCFLLNAALK